MFSLIGLCNVLCCKIYVVNIWKSIRRNRMSRWGLCRLYDIRKSHFHLNSLQLLRIWENRAVFFSFVCLRRFSINFVPIIECFHIDDLYFTLIRWWKTHLGMCAVKPAQNSIIYLQIEVLCSLPLPMAYSFMI